MHLPYTTGEVLDVFVVICSSPCMCTPPYASMLRSRLKSRSTPSGSIAIAAEVPVDREVHSDAVCTQVRMRMQRFRQEYKRSTNYNIILELYIYVIATEHEHENAKLKKQSYK